VDSRDDVLPVRLLTDALGSTLALADPFGLPTTTYSYDPFGGSAQSGAASARRGVGAACRPGHGHLLAGIRESPPSLERGHIDLSSVVARTLRLVVVGAEAGRD
jgi:hypothetical protein